MAGFNLENMKAMADLLKFIDKFDAKFNSIEDSVKNTSKGMKDMAGAAKAMDGSFGGSTGNVGNGSGGSVMSQPPMPGGKATNAASPGFKAAQESAEAAFKPRLTTNVPLPGQTGGTFISDVLNGPIGKIIKPAFLAGYNALPSVEETFQMNTLKNRLRFQGFGSDADITAMLRTQTGAGTANSPMDFLSGFGDTRQLGTNFGSIARNLSIASNLTPGAGYGGAATALSSLNAPRNVNFLRMLGIQIRDSVSGDMRDLDKIIDDLWNVISRQARNRTIPISVKDLRLSLQPGNALASLLDQYFGNDP